jgi:hypothetical protein
LAFKSFANPSRDHEIGISLYGGSLRNLLSLHAVTKNGGMKSSDRKEVPRQFAGRTMTGNRNDQLEPAMTLLNMVYSSVSFGLSAVCGTCLPNGCVVGTHSLGDWTESAEEDPHLLWGGVRTRRAHSGFWEGERASEGRGCLERGTLNAERKANRKGAALFDGLRHDASSNSQLRDSKCQSQCNRENDNGT